MKKLLGWASAEPAEWSSAWWGSRAEGYKTSALLSAFCIRVAAACHWIMSQIKCVSTKAQKEHRE